MSVPAFLCLFIMNSIREFFFFFKSAKIFFNLFFVQERLPFLFVCLFCFCWVECVVGVSVCVCTKGRGEAFVWDGVGCFCCLKNPGYDKFMLMICYMMHLQKKKKTFWCINLHFNACMDVFFIFHSYWGSPLLGSLWWLFSGCSCWALFTFCLSFFLPNFAGSRLLLHFDRPITALRSGGFQTTSVW